MEVQPQVAHMDWNVHGYSLVESFSQDISPNRSRMLLSVQINSESQDLE